MWVAFGSGTFAFFAMYLLRFSKSACKQLDNEALTTSMYQSEAKVNSRPLTTDGLNSPSSLELLTPNHLLTSKADVLLPPERDFKRADLYSRERWRRIQHLAHEFSIHWRKIEIILTRNWENLRMKTRRFYVKSENEIRS